MHDTLTPCPPNLSHTSRAGGRHPGRPGGGARGGRGPAACARPPGGGRHPSRGGWLCTVVLRWVACTQGDQQLVMLVCMSNLYKYLEAVCGRVCSNVRVDAYLTLRPIPPLFSPQPPHPTTASLAPTITHPAHPSPYTCKHTDYHSRAQVVREAHNVYGARAEDGSYLGPFAGSTAVVALLGGGQLVVGSVGDSRAVVSVGGVAHTLTRDHKPGDPGEARRIWAVGTGRGWGAGGGGGGAGGLPAQPGHAYAWASSLWPCHHCGVSARGRLSAGAGGC